MLSNLQNANLFPITALEIFANIGVALLCGLAIAWLYRHTYRGPGYSVAFVNALVFLTMITAVMILAIGSNLARAFGLVGAMSIIRFRTAVKETQDIVYIFFVLAVGMAAGGGYHKIAILATVVVGAIIYVMSKSAPFASRRTEYLLQFAYAGNGDGAPAFVPILHKFCRSHQVINTRSMGADGESLEISYYVRLKDQSADSDLVRELRHASGVTRVNLYCDEEEV